MNLLSLLHRTPVLHTAQEGSGPPIIFLHGIGSSSTSWRNTIPLLRSQYTCITIDLLGFGGSPKPTYLNYTIEDHVKSIAKTIRKLHIREPFIMVGHSLGSLLACRYAAGNARKVKHLIMVSPPIYLTPAQHSNKKAKTATDIYLRLYKFLRGHKNFTIRNAALADKLIPGSNILDITEQTWIPFTRSLENCIENQTVITDVANVQAPVDVIYGTFDEFIVSSNMNLLGSLKNVVLHKVQASTHAILKPLARQIAKVITSSN